MNIFFKIICFYFIFTNLIYANGKDTIEDDSSYILLNEEENTFLENNRVKVISSKTWAPINMNNEEEKLAGIAVDFWNLISKRANINSETIIAKDWNEVLESIKNRTADITLGTTYDMKKKEYANFTTPYISFPIAFATLFDKRFIPNGSFLEGKKVAVGENYSSYVIMKKKYPKINFVQVKNTEVAMKLLSAGKVDAVIDILPVIAHLISINGYYNLKISGTSEERVNISFMIRSDYPELLSIVNKHIAQITPMDKANLINQWLTVKFDKRLVDYEYFYQALILLIILLIFYIFKQKDLKRYNKQLEELSKTDALTKLYNRRKIDEILNKLQNKKYSLILLDIDNFKEINDVFGHLEGDKVLIKIAELLKNNINSNDVLGRWGGEEFLLICKNTKEHEAYLIAERLRKLIEENDFKIRKVTASFGVSEANKKTSIKDVLAKADIAMYNAKQNGRNQVIVSSDLK
jgi:polar amino acid transport system substrate-binding protein